MQHVLSITFPNGNIARVGVVEQAAELTTTLDALGLARSKPILVVVGGAGSLTEAELARLRPLFVDVLAPVAEQVGASVVDGGTAAGVMRLMGEARQLSGASFPLIGVAAVGTVVLPGVKHTTQDAASLDAAHTHFVLVPGTAWGDEVAWISEVASELAAGSPSLTVLVSGGRISYDDVDESIHAARPVLAIAGSGGTADVLATALDDANPSARTREAVESGLLWAAAPDGSNVLGLAALIRGYLSNEGAKDGCDEHL